MSANVQRRKRAWPHGALTVLVRMQGRRTTRARSAREALTPSHTLAGKGKLSDLQGHEDVEGRRSERRSQSPLAPHAPSDNRKVRSRGLQPDEHRRLTGSGFFVPESP